MQKEKKFSEESQDTFTCQETNGKGEGSSEGSKLWGLIHNHSAAKTFSKMEVDRAFVNMKGFDGY